jgi:phage-related minor tail protein
MTNNVYKTAQGKMIDMGALTLQNEQVRAVGNMGVNARGDRVDENNRVIDNRASQIQRQVKRQTNVVAAEVHTSSAAARKAKAAAEVKQALAEDVADVTEEVFTAPLPAVEPVAAPEPVEPATSGLAAALARAKK